MSHKIIILHSKDEAMGGAAQQVAGGTGTDTIEQGRQRA